MFHKNRIRIGFLIIIVLVLTSGFIYFKYLGLPPLTTWLTYQGNGYSFKYPPGMNIRQAMSDDLFIEDPPISTLIFVDPFRYSFSPSAQSFSDWYSSYIADQKHMWQIENTSIRNFEGPNKLTENKYQITYSAQDFGDYWLFHKQTFLITNDHIIILTWRPLPKSFTDPWSSDKSFIGQIAYQTAFARQSKAYDIMVTTFSPISATPEANIYTSPVYNGAYYRVPLPAGWIANPFSEYTGNAPLNNTLGVEFYKPEHKEWSWTDSEPSNRIQVKFIENSIYQGPLEKYPEITNISQQVQFITNHKGISLANLNDGRVLLSFPENSICVFQLGYTGSDEVKEEFNNIVMNLEILTK
jgi:hypothetical protein